MRGGVLRQDRKLLNGLFNRVALSIDDTAYRRVHAQDRARATHVGAFPVVFPAMSPLRNARFGGYPAFMAAELAVHRGNAGKDASHMIKTEILSGNALRIVVPEKLKAGDFSQIAPQIDGLISQHGQIRLLIDASGFNGWENISAFEHHAGFVKNHQRKVERIAVIVAHDWQHWLIGTFRIFVHPEVRAYDKTHEAEALKWIIG
jgi:hypothetical protein